MKETLIKLILNGKMSRLFVCAECFSVTLRAAGPAGGKLPRGVLVCSEAHANTELLRSSVCNQDVRITQNSRSNVWVSVGKDVRNKESFWH